MQDVSSKSFTLLFYSFWIGEILGIAQTINLLIVMIAYPLFRLAGNLINSCLNLAINDILDGFSGGNNVCTVLLKDITHIMFF